MKPKSTPTYKRIEAILKNKLDEVSSQTIENAVYMPQNDNVRGAYAK